MPRPALSSSGSTGRLFLGDFGQPVAVEDQGPPLCQSDETDFRQRVHLLVHSLAGGPQHGRQVALRDGNGDFGRAVIAGPPVADGERTEQAAQPAAQVQEGAVADDAGVSPQQLAQRVDDLARKAGFSSMAASKSVRLRARQLTSVSAMAPALRGKPSSKEISPTTSPGSMRFSVSSLPSPATKTIRRMPSVTM